jgi:Arc/MetJ family transcription regulator
MRRSNVETDDQLIRKAAKLTGLKTKKQIVRQALELLVKAEERKEILQYFGSGVWKGDSKALRRNRV